MTFGWSLIQQKKMTRIARIPALVKWQASNAIIKFAPGQISSSSLCSAVHWLDWRARHSVAIIQADIGVDTFLAPALGFKGLLAFWGRCWWFPNQSRCRVCESSDRINCEQSRFYFHLHIVIAINFWSVISMAVNISFKNNFLILISYIEQLNMYI